MSYAGISITTHQLFLTLVWLHMIKLFFNHEFIAIAKQLLLFISIFAETNLLNNEENSSFYIRR